MSNKGYIKNSRIVVLKALKLLDKGWHTTTEIKDIGRKELYDEAQETEECYGHFRTGGSWCVFDWTDRISRHLNYWVKKGVVEHKKENYRHYFKYIGGK